MNVELDVNGILVSVDSRECLAKEQIPLYMLLRVGDVCEVNDMGVIYKGDIRNIIKLSNGKTLFSVRLSNNPMKEWDLYDSSKVLPPDAEQRALHITSMEMILRKYEPKGMSTNVNIWS